MGSCVVAFCYYRDMSLRLVAAFAAGTLLFAVLPRFADPMTAQGDEVGRAYLLGFGGAALVGAVVVLIAGRAWAALLGGLLCPLTGTLAYTVLFLLPLFGAELSPALVLLTFAQLLPFAAVGASLAAGALAVAPSAGWRDGIPRSPHRTGR